MSNYAVNCYTCATTVYEGDDPPPEDGQVLLTRFADAQCPLGGAPRCPNVTTAIAEQQSRKPVTRAELTAVKNRLAALEAKVE